MPGLFWDKEEDPLNVRHAMVDVTLKLLKLMRKIVTSYQCECFVILSINIVGVS